jgi:hypothetical protein
MPDDANGRMFARRLFARVRRKPRVRGMIRVHRAAQKKTASMKRRRHRDTIRNIIIFLPRDVRMNQ